MSIEIAKYTFTPWVRKGISGNINESDTLGSSAGAISERATIPVKVSVNTEDINKTFSIIGPGDILGINKDMIIRTEPRNWITNFEPNYLAFIEFYDEDFAWRYTPASPSGERLRPWISLLVLEEGEFTRTTRKLPLPSIKVTAASSFPPNSQTWAWAHAHTNKDFAPGELNDLEEFLRSLNKKFQDSPDDFYCRLMSPRNLAPDKSYFAFVVPTFEAGRLAGLSLPTTGVPAQQAAWDDTSTDTEFPVYYEWYFRTGKEMDFEYLIRQLKPRTIDKRVGVRDMDCAKPEFGIKTGTKPSILGLEGALKSPTAESSVFPVLPREEEDFQKELQYIINLPYKVQQQDNAADPVVSAPIYANKHALTDEVNIDSDTWLHKLNTDPRNRVPSGFGTRVIQKDQEKFMQKAWQQVEKIIEANKKITFVRAALSVSNFIAQKSFMKFDNANLLAVAKPVLSKIMGSPTTIYHQLKTSKLNTTVVNSSFRKMVRPRGKLIRKLHQSTDKRFRYTDLVADINSGRISPAPPKIIPSSIPNNKELSSKIIIKDLPKWLKWLKKSYHIIFIILIVLFLLLTFLISKTTFGPIASAIVIAYVLIYRYFTSLEKKSDAKNLLGSPKDAVSIIEKLPPNRKFELHISDPDDGKIPSASNNVRGLRKDSIEAERFRKAAVNFNTLLDITSEENIKEEEKLSFNLATAWTKVVQAITPAFSYSKYLQAHVKFPHDFSFQKPEKIVPAMAYPDFEEPMYAKLRDISVDLLIPNINLVPDNTISLLITNQPFIESYMVGLNHEMGRELLWREYPTDSRGSYFRQFWDVNGIIGIKDEETDEAEMKEKYKDIKPIHTWISSSKLGSHNNRDAEGDETQVVLMIKGELFKHYPNTVLFAQKAHKKPSVPDEKEIKLELTDEEIKKEIKFPLYKAEINPDIKFFGFDLTTNQASGVEKTPGFDDHEGWFFVIQQAPGEPRFGMDIEISSNNGAPTWDDISWKHFTDENMPFIDLTESPSLVASDDTPEGRWGADSAQMAYVLYQKPVMIAVHGTEMLEGF